ncbi:L-rhamnose mutarotase [Olivibacter domesticus]|nr:L-rhamnose mutarotase [Olivibacter domesticus]
MMIRFIGSSYLLLLLALSACQSGGVQIANSQCLVQVIAKDSSLLDEALIYQLAGIADAETAPVYRWKNYYVFYGTKEGTERIYQACLQKYPQYEVQKLDHPFYAFDRSHCTRDDVSSEETDHILLSANLVKNEELQQEYLIYHKDQFEQWPEVSQGFCKAQFQQVLVYKNGRQLLLVINIPKGANFKELDAKTIENNPKVVVWNKLMATYQEGLPGTDEGETWVFFEMMNDEL